MAQGALERLATPLSFIDPILTDLIKEKKSHSGPLLQLLTRIDRHNSWIRRQYEKEAGIERSTYHWERISDEIKRLGLVVPEELALGLGFHDLFWELVRSPDGKPNLYLGSDTQDAGIKISGAKGMMVVDFSPPEHGVEVVKVKLAGVQKGEEEITDRALAVSYSFSSRFPQEARIEDFTFSINRGERDYFNGNPYLQFPLRSIPTDLSLGQGDSPLVITEAMVKETGVVAGFEHRAALDILRGRKQGTWLGPFCLVENGAAMLVYNFNVPNRGPVIAVPKPQGVREPLTIPA